MGDLDMAGDATTPRRCTADEEATTPRQEPRDAAAPPARARRRRTHTLSRCAFLLGLRGCSGGWVDPDTPQKHHTTKSLRRPEAGKFELVYSDEFEVPGRTFDDGHDPRGTAVDKNDYTNMALHFYVETRHYQWRCLEHQHEVLSPRRS